MPSMYDNLRLPMISPVLDLFLSLVIVTVATGAMQFFQAQSKTQDGPSLDSLAQWEQRIASLQARYEELLRELDRLPSPQRLAEVNLKELEVARQRLLQELAALRQDVARLQEALQKAQQQQAQADGEHQRLADEMAGLRRQIEALEAKLQKVRQDRGQIEKLRKELEELLRRLKEAQERYQDLAKKIIAERTKQTEQGSRVRVHPRFQNSGLERKMVVIHQTTVTPVCAPYYEAQYRLVGGEAMPLAPVYELKRRGADAVEALRAGSDFMQWVEKLDPKRQYVFLFVDPASFGTFRAVRAQLQERGIQCGWEPAEDVVALGAGLKGGQKVTTGVQ